MDIILNNERVRARDNLRGVALPLNFLRNLDLEALIRRYRLSYHWQDLLLVAWFGLLSYGPMLQSYVWAIDDFPLSEMARLGWLEYLGNAFYERGVWRLLQHGLVGLILNYGTWLPGFVALGSHILTCQFFYLVFDSLFSRRADALTLALIAACSPFGFQAITWTSALPYVLSSLILWASLWTFLRIHFIPKWIWVAWAIIFGLSLLIHDHLLFALFFVSGASWLLTPQPVLARAWWKRFLNWVPPMMVCVYLAAYVIWKPQDHPLYMEPHFHWPSLLGPLVRLWRWLDIGDTYFCPALWQIAASEWPWGWWGLGLCMVGGIAALWFHPLVPSALKEIDKEHVLRAVMAMFILFLMASLIYVPAGGFSLDSRKRYPLFLFLLGGLGMIVLPWGRRMIPLLQAWKKRTAMILLVAVLMSCCWLHIGLWRAEARATRLLSDFIALNPDYHHVYASKLVDPAKICPSIKELHGGQWLNTFYIELAFIMDHPGQARAEIKDRPGVDTTSVYYDYKTWTWKVSRSNPQ